MVLLSMLCLGCGGGDAYRTFNPDGVAADEANYRAAIFNDPAVLAERITYLNQPIAIGDAVGIDPVSVRDASPTKTLTTGAAPSAGEEGLVSSQAAANVTLTLIAEVSAPTVNGEVVQATSIALDGGDKAMVSYNMRGTPRLGAIHWITDLTGDPVVRSEITFNDSDVNAVARLGAYVFAASATDADDMPFPAVLERIKIVNDRFTLQDNLRIPLTSFAATSVMRSSNVVYATSGSAGEVGGYDKNDLAELGTFALHDARWVDWDRTGKRIVVAQGTPGQISIFEEDAFAGGTMNLLHTFPFPGADLPESKSTVDIAGSNAFIAAGPEGVQIMCLDTGEIVGSVARPDPASVGLDPSVVVTNAVAVDKDLMFISNGEAGVYVAAADGEFGDSGCESPPEITALGKLQFGDLESVNHVAFENDTLFIAVGLGGVKVVEVAVSQP